MGRFATKNASKLGHKYIYPKLILDPVGKLKQLFLAHFELVVTRFGPWKIPKCLANGPLWDQKWVKNRSKTHFSTRDPTPFGMHQQVVLAHFAPVLRLFGPWKMPKGIENGPF